MFFVISVFIPNASPPERVISLIIDSSLENLLAAKTTEAPLDARPNDKDFPIPDEAPVMTHTFPDKFKLGA